MQRKPFFTLSSVEGLALSAVEGFRAFYLTTKGILTIYGELRTISLMVKRIAPPFMGDEYLLHAQFSKH